MRLVEGFEGPVGQVRDDFGIAAGVEAVGHIRKERLLRTFGQHGIRGGVDPLHFVVDHALVAQGAFGAVGLDVPAFLLEAVFVDAGEEDSVKVDVDQIVEVLKVGAGHWIAGLVREGEGVQEGLERALEQLDEGLLHRVFFRAAEHGMLKDVRNARGIFRRGAEGRAEAFVFVVVEHGEQFRAGRVMPPQLDGTGHFGKPFFAHEGKAMRIH